jgi:hypothetical protein
LAVRAHLLNRPKAGRPAMADADQIPEARLT